MSKAQEIARLQSLAALVLDKKLADLRVLATAKNETQARLADLATAEIFMQSGGDVADVVAALAYQGYAACGNKPDIGTANSGVAGCPRFGPYRVWQSGCFGCAVTANP
jgi:hypothetical protein